MVGGKRDAAPIDVSPEDYERQVLSWLRASEASITPLTVAHREVVYGSGGDYQIDVVVEFSAFGGAEFRILVECKKHGRPVERDHVLAFAMKLLDTGSHKGIVFSTAGFQSGALTFAKSKGIATIRFVDGRSTYETKGRGPFSEPPAWVKLPRFAGWMLSPEGSRVLGSLVDEGHLEAIQEWLKEPFHRSDESVSDVK